MANIGLKLIEHSTTGIKNTFSLKIMDVFPNAMGTVKATTSIKSFCDTKQVGGAQQSRLLHIHVNPRQASEVRKLATAIG